MPSSRCQQISLVLGELYNDIRMLAPITPQNGVLLRKQLSEYARQLDAIVDEAEKSAFQFGVETVTMVKKEDNVLSKLDDAEE